MKLFLNGAQLTLEPSQSSLLQLLSSQGIKAEGIAVAINNRIIMRTAWSETTLCEGDKVTVIQATYGG